MTNQSPALRCLAEDCARAALARLRNKGLRVVNHNVWLDGQEMEWLTIVCAGGAVKIVQHYPVPRRIGTFTPEQARTLTKQRVPAPMARSDRRNASREWRRRT